MTRIARQLARRLWNLMLPLRRAAAGRIDRRLDRLVQMWLERTEPSRAEERQAIEDMMLVADALVRELVRLQGHVEVMEETIAQRDSTESAPRLYRGAA